MNEEQEFIKIIDAEYGFLKWGIGRQSEILWFVHFHESDPSKDWSVAGKTPFEALKKAVELIRKRS